MSEISSAIKHICEEKGLSYEAVLTTIESALAAAYRKDYGQKNQNIIVEFDPETAKSKVYDFKVVVEDMPEEPFDAEAMEGREEDVKDEAKVEEKKKKGNKGKDGEDLEILKQAQDGKGEAQDGKDSVQNNKEKVRDDKGKIQDDKSGDVVVEEEERKFNPKLELQLSDAKLLKKTAKTGDEIRTKLEVPESYGRMAAQTAKQVIIQRLREAEREMIFNDFKEKEHEVVSGSVQRREGRFVLVDLGKSTGVLPQEEQISGEIYKPGDRVKVYVKEVNLKARGPEIILSRTSDEILRKIFYLEIPEISNGLIELKSVAREAGSRSKVAVSTESGNVDPIGSCVGQRGSRIQTIIAELGGEKVDIIDYDEDSVKFISNALSPAKILSIELDEDNKKARVKVSNDQLSLAIGKGGQNARLAAKLTGWKIDIVEDKEVESEKLKVEILRQAQDKSEDGEVDEKKEVKEKKVKDDVKEKKTEESEDKTEKKKEAKEKKTEKKKKNEKQKEEEDKDKADEKKEAKEKKVSKKKKEEKVETK
jgi:N utilization substance protein A